ncbi:MAG: isoprenyl transferase [Cyclobacteriaceae bacterium]
MATFRDQIDPGKLPRHIAVIMDGNGRWAKNKGAARIFGHRNAVQSVREVTEGCGELGVEYLTLYAFSTENWGRPKEEVDALMELLVSTLKKEIQMLHDNHVRLLTIGDIGNLPSDCRINLSEAVAATAGNKGLKLVIALNYSGRSEILKAAQMIGEDIRSGKLSSSHLTESVFAGYLETGSMPDPELLIRTSGEMRISNFLLWQIAYTELYITSKLWPDFRKEDLFEAICAFQKRERRFGKVLETNRA